MTHNRYNYMWLIKHFIKMYRESFYKNSDFYIVWTTVVSLFFYFLLSEELKRRVSRNKMYGQVRLYVKV